MKFYPGKRHKGPSGECWLDPDRFILKAKPHNRLVHGFVAKLRHLLKK